MSAPSTLVVGGTGNISTSIVHGLVAKGHDVSVLSRGQRAGEQAANVEQLHADRRDRVSMAAALAGRHFDHVIDMITFDASDAEIAVDVYAPLGAHVVVCSTVVVYGNQFTHLPVTEEHVHQARDPYGYGKVEAERVLRAASKAGLLDLTIIRPSHTYGRIPIVRQLTVAQPGFVERLRAGRPIVVTDTAESTLWSACHVDDVAAAFVDCLGRSVCLGQSYNVVGDEVYTWANYHRRVAEAIGCEADLVPASVEAIVAAGQDQVAMLKPVTAHPGWFNNAKARRDLPGFRPSISLQDGIRSNVAWLEERGMIGDDAPSTWEDALIARVRGQIR
jgi:nucleoside-diphosphate-sugar epimerase